MAQPKSVEEIDQSLQYNNVRVKWLEIRAGFILKKTSGCCQDKSASTAMPALFL